MKKTRWIEFLGGSNLLYTLAVIFLISLTILILTLVDFVFTPIIVIFSNILMPIIIAVLFYYLLDPLVSLFEKKMSRMWATSLVFIIILIFLAVLVAILIPVLSEQIANLIESFPVFLNDVFSSIQDLLANLPANDFFYTILQSLQDLSNTLFDNLGQIFSQGITNVTNVVSSVTNVVFTLGIFPVILFFLLKDEEKIIKGLLFVTPPTWRKSLIRIGAEVNLQVGAYIKGQLIVAVANGVMMFVGFTLIGLNYAVALSVLGGFLSLIPYIGPILTFIPAIFIAAFDSFTEVLLLLVVWAIIQFAEGNFIEPNVMGKRLNIHPVTIIITLLVMGDLFGLFGLVFGIPMYAILKVIVIHFYMMFKSRYNEYFGDRAGEYEVDSWDSKKYGDKDILETKDEYVEYLYKKELNS